MKNPKIYICSNCGSRKIFYSWWKWIFSFTWMHIDPRHRWYKCDTCNKLTHFKLAPKNINKIKTWEDKGNWENAHCPAHAEGWACAPGSKILIRNKEGKEEVIPFDPKTLALDAEVIDWNYEGKL